MRGRATGQRSPLTAHKHHRWRSCVSLDLPKLGWCRPRRRIGDASSPPLKLGDINSYIDRANKQVRATNGDTLLDYGKGLLTLRAPAAQGAIGNLSDAGTITLPNLEIQSFMAKRGIDVREALSYVRHPGWQWNADVPQRQLAGV